MRRAPIPAPQSDPPGKLNYSDLLLTTFTPLRDPSSWPQYAQQLDAAANGDASALEDVAWGPVQGWWLWAPCAANWPAHSTDSYAGPWNRRTKNPILLINNLHDPADKYVNAQRTERLLGNAVLLTNAGYGHPVPSDPSKCIDRWRARYLVRLATPPRGTVCKPERRPFDPDFGNP